MNESFAQILRQWRQARRYSQLQLALELDVSSRHLSFLETGRAQASRDMILKIALFLLIPKAAVNQALLAAGYAPVYVNNQSMTDLQPALDAIELMLNKHLPYPALVFNSDWDIINANHAAQALLSHFSYQGNNFIEFLIADNIQQKCIINWAQIAEHTLQRIHQETLVKPASKKLSQLVKNLADQLGNTKPSPMNTQNPIILSTQLHFNDQTLAFFSVLAQLSSVQDLTISEYKIELMFPADQTTSAFYLSS